MMNNESENDVLLEIRGVTKRYGSFPALSGISFDMKAGEIISVLGPSGCGKSTLLQMIAGLARPDEGEIRLSGKTIASNKTMVPPEKRGINMVFQDYALWPHLNVFSNIAYGLNKMKPNEKQVRVTELLKLMQLEGLENRLPPQLSGGQQQRIAIARALATQPQLMLLDEPLSNLDMRLRIEMRTEMAYLFRRLGMSVFHVTHDPEEAFSMADRLLIMRKGNIDQMGTPQECFNRPASRHAASLLGAINRLNGTLKRTPEGTAIRLESGKLIYGVAAEGLEKLSDESRLILMFRPEDLMLTSDMGSDSTNDEKAHSECESKRNLFTLEVRYCTFEGNSWRSVVETADSQKLYSLTELPLTAGERITAELQAAKAFLFADEED